MKTLITKLFGAAFILGSASTFATANLYSITNIPDDSFLTLRAWPSTISQPLTNIPSNAKQVEATGKTITLDTTKWLQVNFNDKVGWVESNYLTQTQQASTQIIPSQENSGSVINNAELFSYGPTITAPTTPAPSPLETPEGSVIANNIKYPWSAEADTIYHDPTPDTRETTNKPLKVRVSQATPVIPTPQVPPIATTETPLVIPTSQNSAPTPAIENTTTPAALAPQPIALEIPDTPIDYHPEAASGNRYEHIETASSMAFIPN